MEATERELNKIVVATQRPRRPLKGEAPIGLRIGKVLHRFKMAKHFRLDIHQAGFSYARDEVKIAEEAALDGIYVVRTSVQKAALDTEEAVRAYKDLGHVEQAFRSYKTVDLKVRPIYHYLADRVRAHVFLCMLAYYVEWHMRQALAPLSFDDDDKVTAEAQRDSPVSPAEPSPSAQEKARTLRTPDDFPVHSFQTCPEERKGVDTCADYLVKTVRCCATTAIWPRASPLPRGSSKRPAVTSSKTAWTSPGHAGDCAAPRRY